MRSHYLLVVGLVLAGSTFAALAYLLWINRGGEQALLLFLKAVCGPLLVTLFLIGYDLARPVEIVQATVPITFYESSGNVFANRTLSENGEFSRLPIGYYLTEAVFGAWLQHQQKPPPLEEKYRIYLDSLEASFIHWLTLHYLMHWQVETKRELIGFEGPQGTIRGTIDGAEKKPLMKTVTDFQKLLANPILNAQDFGAFKQVALPSGAKISHRSDERTRQIAIETPQVAFSVSFEIQGGWQLKYISGSSTAKKILNVLGEEAEGTYYSADFVASPKKWRRWSSRTEDEMKWAKGMIDFFKHDFEWQQHP